MNTTQGPTDGAIGTLCPPENDVNAELQTLNPAPYTLHTDPGTLNPTP